MIDPNRQETRTKTLDQRTMDQNTNTCSFKPSMRKHLKNCLTMTQSRRTYISLSCSIHYEWTEAELEDIDRQISEWLRNKGFMKACFKKMQEEHDQRHVYNVPLRGIYPPATRNKESAGDQVSTSILNPEAPEFIPWRIWQSEQMAVVQVSPKMLNPEAPEFIPRRSWQSLF